MNLPAVWTVSHRVALIHCINEDHTPEDFIAVLVVLAHTLSISYTSVIGHHMNLAVFTPASFNLVHIVVSLR